MNLKLLLTSLFLITNATNLFAYMPKVHIHRDINYHDHEKYNASSGGGFSRGGNRSVTGNISNLRTIGQDYHNTISSINLDPGCVATLYEHFDYQGRSETFTKSDPDLRDNFIGNDTASSIKATCTPLFMTIFPPTSRFIRSQSIDVVIVVEEQNYTLSTDYTLTKATFDGVVITDFLSHCVKKGKLVNEKGATFRCPNILVKEMSAGSHTFTVEIDLRPNFGASYSRVQKTVTWTVLESEEN